MGLPNKGPVNRAFTTNDLRTAYLDLGCDKTAATIAFPVYDASLDQVIYHPTIGQLLGALMLKMPYKLAETEDGMGPQD